MSNNLLDRLEQDAAKVEVKNKFNSQPVLTSQKSDISRNNETVDHSTGEIALSEVKHVVSEDLSENTNSVIDEISIKPSERKQNTDESIPEISVKAKKTNEKKGFFSAFSAQMEKSKKQGNSKAAKKQKKEEIPREESADPAKNRSSIIFGGVILAFVVLLGWNAYVGSKADKKIVEQKATVSKVEDTLKSLDKGFVDQTIAKTSASPAPTDSQNPFAGSPNDIAQGTTQPTQPQPSKFQQKESDGQPLANNTEDYVNNALKKLVNKTSSGESMPSTERVNIVGSNLQIPDMPSSRPMYIKKPVGDSIPGTERNAESKIDDPLSNTSIAMLAPQKRTSPYAVYKLGRKNGQTAVFIAPVADNGLADGVWAGEGYVFNDGWTIVEINGNGVKLMSPGGRIVFSGLQRSNG